LDSRLTLSVGLLLPRKKDMASFPYPSGFPPFDELQYDLRALHASGFPPAAAPAARVDPTTRPLHCRALFGPGLRKGSCRRR
jgi:hypothetical protein